MDEKKVREAIELIRMEINILEGIENCGRVIEARKRKHIALYNIAIEALEKQLAKKPICVPKSYSEELGFNDEIHCLSCGGYVGYFTEGMSEPEQMEYCCDCGQRIAKDWSE